MSEHKTLLLGQADIARTMLLADYVEAVERAFGRLAQGKMSVPAVVHIPAPDGACHVKSAGFIGEPSYIAVKVNANFPDNPRVNGLPTIQGAIVLCDGKNGSLLAVLDSIEITAMRTGAATAVAAKYLARAGSEIATVIGCGIQGRVQLLSLLEVLSLNKVFAFDTDRKRMDAFIEQMHTETGLDISSVDDLAEATLASQVIVTCTSSRAPFLGRRHVAPGTFIAAVGADNDDKQELEPELLAHSRVIVDLLEQCASIGELHHALEAGTMTRANVLAELGEIVAGIKVVDFSPDDIIVFDSTGSAIQDVAAAGMIFERAMSAGIGQRMEFA
ncbi:MAG: ornithine cyclodeaminase family protein [Woeseiaceae bacterium]|nr:ornithine cyclodeaminase family protein [Woeseiaceae bacterium]